MTDTSGVVPAIKGDQESRLWVELWGDGLHRIGVPKCTLSLSFGDVSGIDHVHCFNLGGDFFCPPVFGRRGSSSSSLYIPLSLFSAFNLPACLNTQQSLLV